MIELIFLIKINELSVGRLLSKGLTIKLYLLEEPLIDVDHFVGFILVGQDLEIQGLSSSVIVMILADHVE